VLGVQRDHLLARISVGLGDQRLQSAAQSALGDLVGSGPPRVFVEDYLPLASRRLAQQLRDAGVEVGRFTEALPHVVPSTTALRQLASGGGGSIVVGIEVQIGATDGTEGPPARFVLALTESCGITHPAQHVANRIGDGQPVEVLGLQATSSQAMDGRFGKKGQCAAGRLPGARVLSEVQAKAIVRHEKGLDGPIAAVALMPDAPTVLELD